MPNRQDMNMVLGQMDELGNTLMKNRVLKQQEQERNDLMGQRERFQQTDTNLRTKQLDQNAQMHKDQMQTNSDWKTQADDQHTLQIGIKANADGSMDEAGRQKFNQWILAHPKLAGTGIQLIAPPAPKEAGQMETANTRDFKQLQELQALIAKATNPQEKQQAEAAKAQFEGMISRRSETPPEPYDPAQKAALSAGGAEWAKANAENDQEKADRILSGINATRANASQAKSKPPVVPGANGTPPAVSATYPSEAAARAAGQKSGDVVKLQGIGTVRLK